MADFLQLEQIKETIALLSEKITADPEAHLDEDKEHPTKLSTLGQLFIYATPTVTIYHARVSPDAPPPPPTTSPNPFPAQLLALLSLSHIFSSICPSYRITVHNTNEKVNKDLHKLRQHESRLVKNYQRYLKLISNLIATPPTDLSSQQTLKLELTIQKALCHLALALTGFNFSSSILSRIISTASRTTNPAIEVLTSATLSSLFKKETDDSVDAVKAICKEVAAKIKLEKRINIPLLATLQSVPLRIHEDESIAVKAHQNATKKQLKRKNEVEKQAALDAASTDATASKLDLAVHQSTMLQSITTLYFRLLRARDERALPTVLRGITKITPLLNIDAVVDVLKEYREIVGLLDPVSQIELCLCSLRMGRGTNGELKNDEAWIVQALYNACLVSDAVTFDKYLTATTGESLLRALQDSLVKRRELSKGVVGAFTKRLLVVAAGISAYDSPLALGLVQFSRLLLARYQFASINLENEEFAPSGMYDGLCDDPDKANPYDGDGGIYWESAVLQHSHHPDIAKAARSMSTGTRLNMPGDDPDKSWYKEKCKERDFRFAMREPKKIKKGFIHSEKWVKADNGRTKFRKIAM